MRFWSGLFQFLSLAFAAGAVGMQIAAITTGWIYFSFTYPNGGPKSYNTLGLFDVCSWQDVGNGWTYSRCASITGAQGFDQEVPLCIEDANKPYDTIPMMSSVLPALRGAEALGIITVLATVGCFTTVLLFICDKIKTAMPVLLVASVSAAGALGTFIVFYAKLNGACPSTYCDEVKKGSAGVEGFHCVAAYGVYLSWGTILCLFGCFVTLCLVNRARRNNDPRMEAGLLEPAVQAEVVKF
jgi:hypothetical protein